MNTHWEFFELDQVPLIFCQIEGVSTEEVERKQQWYRVTKVLSGYKSKLQNIVQFRNT